MEKKVINNKTAVPPAIRAFDMTTTSDILTGRQLLDIFKCTASVNDMQNDDYQHCLKVLQDAPQDQPFYASNRSDRYVIGYCLDYFPPIKDQNNG